MRVKVRGRAADTKKASVGLAFLRSCTLIKRIVEGETPYRPAPENRGLGRVLPAERARLNHRLWDPSPETDRPGYPDVSGLPRKEVIQPHLPVQLPCYDFVPVTSPALGAGLPKGLAVRLQALPASMT